ncbi:MAG: HD domain-containing protein [Spirochaetaceae bacterium]|nr:HD domain-containing protein [Spirochaetaceae bacterium]
MKRRTFNLAGRAIVAFTLFGVLAAYLGMVLVGTQATASLVSTLELFFRETASQFLPARDEGMLRSLQERPNPQASAFFESAMRTSAASDRIETFSLRLRRASEPGVWWRPSLGRDGRLVLEPLPLREAAAIGRALSPGVHLRPRAFLGARDSLKVYLDLSRPDDEWLLAAELTLRRDGAFAGLKGNFAFMMAAFGLWILVTLAVSLFVGRRMAAPVKELAAWARGELGPISRSRLARRDEIGDLSRALTTMRGELEAERASLDDRARAMEAMNRIDRAVLSGVARDELLDRVLAAAESYAGAAVVGLAVRDPDGGGFEIVALRAAGERAAERGLVPDSVLPERVLIRFSDVFELPARELGAEALGLFEIGDHERLNFANLPFGATGLYGGSLFLFRDGERPSLDRLTLLADQAGVALKHLADREARERSWLAVVRSLTRAVDAKSAWTRGHSERVAKSALLLGRRLLMGTRELADLEVAAVLHDVGKIGVPEAILDKPARLDEAEFALVRRHPVLGADIVEDVPEYREIRAAILHHHERWDGSGYPEGLAGEAIPLAARIIALADVYDAITDERPYRRGMSPAEARDFVLGGAGALFDPRLVRIFLELGPESA